MVRDASCLLREKGLLAAHAIAAVQRHERKGTKEARTDSHDKRLYLLHWLLRVSGSCGFREGYWTTVTIPLNSLKKLLGIHIR